MIKAIIFDFAGVLTKEGFRKGLYKKLKQKFDFDEALLDERFLQNEGMYMSGKMSTKIFWQNLCEGLDISFEDFIDAFKSSYEYNLELLDLIEKLKGRYKLVLFSDNFEIISDKIKNELANLFSIMIFSNEIQMTKSNDKSFDYLLSHIGTNPESCLFIDDKEKNLKYPQSIGFRTIKFEDNPGFLTQLNRLGVKI